MLTTCQNASAQLLPVRLAMYLGPLPRLLALIHNLLRQRSLLTNKTPHPRPPTQPISTSTHSETTRRTHQSRIASSSCCTPRHTQHESVVPGAHRAVVLHPAVGDLREPQPVLVCDGLEVPHHARCGAVAVLVERASFPGRVEMAAGRGSCVGVEELASQEPAAV